MRIHFETRNIVPKVFLYCMAVQPIIALLWQNKILFFKLNWLLYPIILFAVAVSISLRKKAPVVFYLQLLVFILFTFVLLGRSTDWEGIFRIFITLLPLTFIRVIQKADPKSIFRTFWILYFLSILVPLFISYLQYTDRFPYYEFDVDETGLVGRISGGYNKPNNFLTLLFPMYLFGFYLWQVKRKKAQGLLLVFFVLGVVYLTGLRIAMAIFLLIFICSFFQGITSQIVYQYYRNYLNFFIGVFCFVLLFFFFQKFGLVDGLRGRIPMWLAHSDEFFRSSWTEILTGKGQILLDKKYEDVILIGSLEEAHNNSFRTIIVFGLVGYFLYCTFIRWLVISVYRIAENPKIKYIRLSCFLFLLLYSMTNEPAYYSSILWSVLIGIFPVWEQGGTLDQAKS